MQVLNPVNDEQIASKTHTIQPASKNMPHSKAELRASQSQSERPSITLSEFRARESEQVSTNSSGACKSFVTFASNLDPLRPIGWTAALPAFVSSLWVMEQGIGSSMLKLGADFIHGNLDGAQITFLVSSLLLGVAVTSQASDFVLKHERAGNTFREACDRVGGGMVGVAALGTSLVAGVHALTGGSEHFSIFTSSQFALGLFVMGAILLFRADPGT